MPFDFDAEFCTLVEKVMEVVVVQLRAEEGVSVHYQYLFRMLFAWKEEMICALPEVSGCRFVNFFSASDSGVSLKLKYCPGHRKGHSTFFT